ncbi:hypothetical protein LEP1GSC059_1389 [Leptospira noguchii serovar Panama str. CZ214]|uniref:Uncharacterized protein n=1 Tax=Leptospira noguchii serovar Panama str. CZ214 TaxID=1001595 RepID=T0FQZ4_9LEPT|nr:hypothetical protein LEP1GSC059_1389 [Leptospira noguchii serovar Panama str. CZ214]
MFNFKCEFIHRFYLIISKIREFKTDKKSKFSKRFYIKGIFILEKWIFMIHINFLIYNEVP